MLLKSKHRLIVFIMVILILVITATLGIIYFTTYADIKKENQEMLTLFADSYETSGLPHGSQEESIMSDEVRQENDAESLPALLPTDENHRYQISTFYAVAFNTDKSVKEYMNDATSNLSDEELVSYATSLLDNGTGYGIDNGVAYLITQGESYYLVTLMDTSVLDNTISSLLNYMFIFGICAIIVLLALALILANWIMAPLNVGFEKQKQFISDAGHELKTPIATINANAEILKRDYPDNQWLDNIIYENERMNIMVQQLLELARLENVATTFEDVDLSSLVEASVLPFEAFAFEQSIDLSYEISENIHIDGNKGSLEKLVSVLTDNAISHCLDNGKVNVSLVQDNKQVVLTVSNTSDPLDAADCEKIFERFYRIDEARADKGTPHYGLGLSIAKAIVKTHHGQIKVECHDGLIYFIITF